jgi:hypothetical protein
MTPLPDKFSFVDKIKAPYEVSKAKEPKNEVCPVPPAQKLPLTNVSKFAKLRYEMIDEEEESP